MTARCAGLLAIILLFAAGQSRATGIQFDFTGGPGQELTFTVPSSFNSGSFSPGLDTHLYNVSGTFDGIQTLFSLDFLTVQGSAFGQAGIGTYCSLPGGSVFFGFGNNSLFGGNGGQFTISWPGNQNVTTFGGWGWDCPANVRSVPEPSSLLLLGIGGAALLGLRRKPTA